MRRGSTAAQAGRLSSGFLPSCSKRSSALYPNISAVSRLASPPGRAHPCSLCLRLWQTFPITHGLNIILSFFCCYGEGHETAGMVSVRAVYEIAQVKAQDECFKMRDASLETVVKSIVGSARSLGIKVVNDLSADDYKVFLEEREEKLKADAAASAAAAAEAVSGKKK
ncbi:hypothetical protein ILYODFUR_016077 [Ilyodon furcidens]|uniref:Large ribosomal subunit protein uL11 C-terminal domain-containing protein n=1 Tax=Ilyodon furcidens TaxID=33524 RepID=A0ABV0VHH6_9TELE